LLLLVIVSILGVGAAQIATMGERSARNDRDMQVAWQSAEAALMDAEFDIHGPGTASQAGRVHQHGQHQCLRQRLRRLGQQQRPVHAGDLGQAGMAGS
jgi:Tfp pilus assembly protein PilX